MYKKKIFPALLHVQWWFLIFIIFQIAVVSTYYPIVRFGGDPFQQWWALTSTMLVCIGSFYGTFFISKRYRSTTHRTLKYVLIGLLVLTLSMAYVYTLIYLYYDGDLNAYFIPDQMPFRTPPILAILPAGIFAIPGMMFQSYHHLKKQQEIELTLQNEKLELALELIKSQLNPHFLFNVLNNIEHLIRKAPDAASESVIRLSSLLRYQVYETAQQKVKIDKEIEMIEAYLALQSLRLDNPELLTFTKKVEHGDVLIEPAIFLPLIENAFKHADLNDDDAFIKINLVVSFHSIEFSMKNSKSAAGVNAYKYGGAGLGLIRKRLEIAYPDCHNLNIVNEKQLFIVRLKIDLS